MAPRIVEVILTGNASQAIAEIERLTGTAEASSAKMSSTFLNIGKVATFALAASAVAVGAFSIKIADDFEASDARLRNAIKNTGGSFDALSGQIDQAKQSGEELGFNNADVENSLARLQLATKDMTLSTRDLSLAEDIARARHIDLESATDMLVKVEGGRYLALSKTLGVSKDIIASFKTTQDAVDFLTQRFQGSAAASAETFQGKIRTLVAQMEDLGIKIGLVLIPIIEQMGGAFVATIGFLEHHKEVALALAIVIGGPLVAAMAAWIATSIVAGATALFAAWAGFATVLMSAVIPSIMAVIAALADLTVAEAIATAGLSLIAAAVALVALKVGDHDFGLKKAIESGKAWGNELVNNSSGIQDNVAHLDQLKASLRDVKGEHVDSFAAAVKQGQAEDILRAAIAALEGQIGAEKVTAAQARTELENLASGTKDLADASQSALKALQQLQNAVLAAQGGEIGLAQAQLNAIDAQQKLTDLQNSGTATAHDLEAATLNVQSANLQAAGAAIKLHDDNAALFATFKDSGVPGLEIMRQKLEDEVAAHGDASGAIQGQIGHINDLIAWIGAIPPDHATNITADASNAYAVLDNLTRRLEAYSQSTYSTSLGAAIGAAIPVYASEGGFVPGTGNTDSVPAMLTPGEFVVSKEMMRGGVNVGGSNASGAGRPMLIQVVLDRKVLGEAMVNEFGRAGGPTLPGRAVNN